MAFEGTNVGGIYVDLALNTRDFNQQLRGVKTNLDQSMATWNRNIVTFNRNYNKITRPIIAAAKAYTAAMTAFSVKALHALYNTNSAEGKAWKTTFDVFKTRMNTEMARLGSMLLRTPIFGHTIIVWMDKFIDFLRRIDTSKLEKLVKLFEAAAVAGIALKSISIGTSMVAGIGKLAAMSGGTTFAGGLLGGAAGAMMSSKVTEKLFSMPWLKGAGRKVVEPYEKKMVLGMPLTLTDQLARFGSYLSASMTKLALIGILIDQICIGWKEALEGIKLTVQEMKKSYAVKIFEGFKLLMDKEYGALGKFVGTPNLGTSDVLKFVRGLPQALASGLGAMAGYATGGRMSGAEERQAASGAMEDFWLKHFFKGEMTPWEKPAEAVGMPGDIGGKFMGLTEGVKFSQQILHQKDYEKRMEAYAKDQTKTMKEIHTELKEGKNK